MRHLDRRSLLIATAAIGAGLLPKALSADEPHPHFSNDPFTLGVASGDPSSDGVVLWTRLARDPLNGGGMEQKNIPVVWQVAQDEKFTRILAHGEYMATPALGHSVHAEVQGLEADRWYFYRFLVGGHVSPIGRTRTLPLAGSLPASWRLAVASCQHFEQGLYTALGHLAAEAPDLVLFLGDYIYEMAGKAGGLRKHVGNECMSLDDYRNRYAQYRSDPLLRQAHAVAPWIITPDDHEFDNNYANLISEEKNVDAAMFVARRAAAYQAFYEHMPLRRASLPSGPNMQIYRRFSLGRLAQIDVLDTRQYRTDQPCGDGKKPPCPEALSEQATVLGSAQRGWLFDGLTSSAATWNILAQQIMIARVDRRVGDGVAYSMDQWPGYEFERQRLLKFYHERGIANPVTLAGDIHSNWANDLQLEDGTTVASEFVATSISSGGNGSATPKDLVGLLRENPFVKFHNAQRGYISVRVDRKQLRGDFRVVPFVDRPDAPLETVASYVVEAGRAGLHKAG